MEKHHMEKRGAPLDFNRRKNLLTFQRLFVTYGPAKVMAAWEMWFYAGEPWSEWAVKTGYGFPGFASPSGIGVIATSSKGRLEAKSRHYGELVNA
jgi:hypothetical protein